LQNRDGGIPTFCRGWGKLPFDRSSSDITAHVLWAWSAWKQFMGSGDQVRVDYAIARAVKFLESAQRPDGAWTPLWFGNQFARKEENPVYGTARVLVGLLRIQPESAAVQRAISWLIAAQNADGGWGGDYGLLSSIEETALAVSSLAGLPGEAARQAASRCSVVIGRRVGKTPPLPLDFILNFGIMNPVSLDFCATLCSADGKIDLEPATEGRSRSPSSSSSEDFLDREKPR
jgi:squalene-hopene/tetraprenyl-beta-curcumene cyclase